MPPSLVVANPDRPVGRKKIMTAPAVKEVALKHNIPVIQPEKLATKNPARGGEVGSAIVQKSGPRLGTRSLTESDPLSRELSPGIKGEPRRGFAPLDPRLPSLGPHYAPGSQLLYQKEWDFFLVVAYGKIIPKAVLDIPKFGTINVHPSLLPKYRGASPVEATLLNDDKTTGVTIQKMAKKLDAGDIIAVEKTNILPNETTIELRARLITIGAQLLVNILPAYEKGEIIPTPQDGTKATYAGKIKKEEGCISLDAPAQENWNKYRAYAQWPGIFFMHEEKRIKITDAELSPLGQLRILRVIPEGKNEMDYKSFIQN